MSKDNEIEVIEEKKIGRPPSGIKRNKRVIYVDEDVDMIINEAMDDFSNSNDGISVPASTFILEKMIRPWAEAYKSNKETINE